MGNRKYVQARGSIARRGRVMMPADRIHDRQRQAPQREQIRADLGMARTDYFVFYLEQAPALLVRFL